MNETETNGSRSGTKLGRHLAAIRDDRGLSLRRVEDLTNKVVSNAYLSQIETGKISQPSPNILHALAVLYRTSYETLMELAGYIRPSQAPNESHGRAATFAELHLTEAEEAELLAYLKFKREREKTGEVR
jgi:HTH-type transcriptional regulator, competence development regulator